LHIFPFDGNIATYGGATDQKCSIRLDEATGLARLPLNKSDRIAETVENEMIAKAPGENWI
jgi:hypothetical protein